MASPRRYVPVTVRPVFAHPATQAPAEHQDATLSPLRRRTPLSLALALVLYVVLAWRCVTAVGVVGEVDLSWALGQAPTALVGFDPPTFADGRAVPTAGHRWGPLVANQVRPVETLQVGGWALPVAVNSYTGGPPDWPARLLWQLTGSRFAVTALHVALGGLLLVLVHRFLRFRGTDVAAAVAALVLASDWSFVFYRKVLGGTEVLLHAAGLLCLWALWSRRWGGGRHGLLALGIGIGMGLMAKATFVLTLLALGLTALLMRWDRAQLNPPAPERWRLPVLAIVVLTSPLWVSALHHLLAVDGHVPSHDFPVLQGRRVLSALAGGPAPAREAAANLWMFFSEPLAFFGPAYGVGTLPGPSPLRLLGLVVVVAGTALAWRDRHPTPQHALLRFTSVFLLLQLLLLWLVARDLHHLAQATPTLAIVAGLALDRLAGLSAPPRSPARALRAGVLALPLILAGSWSLAQTDRVVEQITVPTFTEAGQQALVDMLTAADVQRLLVADYESYGMLELRAPSVDVVHAWPAVALARPAPTADILPELLGAAAGGHLLIVEASQAMGYNLRSSPTQLAEAAEVAGLAVERVQALPNDTAVLYAISKR